MKNAGNIIQKYGKYHSYMKTIAEHPFQKTPTLTELKITQADRQSCWREMENLRENEEFEGTVIDYFCWISTKYIMIQFLEHEDIEIIRKMNKNAFQNMLRLFWKNPKYFLTDEIKNRRKIFNALTEIRYNQVFRK